MKVIVAQTMKRGREAAARLGLGRHEYRVAIHPADLAGVKAQDMVVTRGTAVFREKAFRDLLDIVKSRASLDRVDVPTVDL